MSLYEKFNKKIKEREGGKMSWNTPWGWSNIPQRKRGQNIYVKENKVNKDCEKKNENKKPQD